MCAALLSNQPTAAPTAHGAHRAPTVTVSQERSAAATDDAACGAACGAAARHGPCVCVATRACRGGQCPRDRARAAPALVVAARLLAAHDEAQAEIWLLSLRLEVAETEKEIYMVQWEHACEMGARI